MTISERLVKRACQCYWCETCGYRIVPGESYWRMFGMAHRGEKPFEVFVCTTCKPTNPGEAEK